MNQVLDAWNENDKQTYLSALSYVLTAGDTKSEQRREFMKNKAREVKIPLAQIKKVRAPEDHACQNPQHKSQALYCPRHDSDDPRRP